MTSKNSRNNNIPFTQKRPAAFAGRRRNNDAVLIKQWCLRFVGLLILVQMFGLYVFIFQHHHDVKNTKLAAKNTNNHDSKSLSSSSLRSLKKKRTTFDAPPVAKKKEIILSNDNKAFTNNPTPNKIPNAQMLGTPVTVGANQLKPHASPSVSVFNTSNITTKNEEPPITIRFQFPKLQPERIPCDDDIPPCEVYNHGGTGANFEARIDGTEKYHFALYTMEGAGIFPQLAVPDKRLRKLQENTTFYATTSFDSDIPLPYYSPKTFDIQSPANAVNYDTAIKGASFIASNCKSRNGRESTVHQLINATYNVSDFRIYSLGSCLHNADPPNGLQITDSKTVLMQQYLFHLAFENQRYNDYITEKLWGSLASGTVPVYYGPGNIKDHHLPPNSVIYVDDFPNKQDLAKYLIKVSQNKTLYESYHAWRYQPLPQSFQRKYNFTSAHSLCRMCRFVHAKRHGLQWDHERQDFIR